MDFLDNKKDSLLSRLRRLQKESCCLHIDKQIGLWYQDKLNPNVNNATSTTITNTNTSTTTTTTTTTTSSNTNTTTTTKAIVAANAEQATTTVVEEAAAVATANAVVNPEQLEAKLAAELAQPEPHDEEQTVGCFLSNIRHLESFDSDATESTTSYDSYDELEGFSHEDIPPRKINYQSSSRHAVLQTLHQRRTNINQQTGGAASSVTINDNYDPSDLKKKAIWKWANERSRLASRWTWLQAQVADLEFRIRGQNDAHMQAKQYKTQPLPSVLPENSCSRTVPISKDFRRRRLIKSSQILSNSNKKLVKFSHVPCICSSLPQTVAPCLSCNGRYNYLRQIEGENAPIPERISQLDPCYHPVLSIPDDMTLGSQIAYLLKQEAINRKPTKGRPGRKKGSTAANIAAAHAAAAAAAAANGNLNGQLPGKKGKYYHGMVGRPPGQSKNPSQTMITSNKLRRKYRKHSNNTTNNYNPNQWPGANNHGHSSRRIKRIRRASSMNESSVCSESSGHYRPYNLSNSNSAQGVTRRRRSEQSAYDIDNIVIPFSIAATTRVEILEYKEIVTPSWRVSENGTCPTTEATATVAAATQQQQQQPASVEEEIEDTSDEAYITRHSKGESEEKRRLLRLVRE